MNIIKTNYEKLKSQNLTLWMNHLLVVYSFLIPISDRGKSTVFFVLLVLFFLRGDFRYYLSKSISNKFVQATLLFFAVHIIWLIGTENFIHAKTVIKDMKYLLLPLLFLSFLDKSFFFRIFTAFILGMLYSEMISYLIHFNFIPHKLFLYNKEVFEAYSIYDPTPFIDHSRYTVLLSLSIALLFYSLLNNSNGLLIKTISALFIISATANLFFIGGRIGYISFFIILFFVTALRYKDNIIKSVLSLAVGLSLVFLIAYNFGGLFKQRVDQSVKTIETISKDNSNLQSSFGLRLGFWIYSGEVIKDNFLFGVGTGDHMDKVKAVIPENHLYLKQLSHPHNEYIKTFLQFGILGFLLFLNIFYQILKYDTNDTNRNNIKIIVLIVIMIAITTSILGSGIYLPLLATLISATLAKENFLENSANNLSKNTVLLYISLILAALIIAFLQ